MNHESEARLAQEATAALSHALWLTNETGRIEWANDAAKNLDPLDDREHIQAIFEKGEQLDFETVPGQLAQFGGAQGRACALDPGTGTRWFHVEIKPRVEGPGWAVCAWRLRGEERAAALPMRADKLLEDILGQGGIGVWKSDTTTDQVTWSDKTYELMMIEPGTPLHQGSFFLAVHEDDRAALAEEAAASIAGDRPYCVQFRVEAARKSGTDRHLEARGKSLRDTDAQPLLYLGTVRDITEELRASAHLTELKERLGHSQGLESMGALIAGVAHDFNNLLTIIWGNTELVQQLIVEDKRSSTMLGHAVQSCRRASELTRQLLFLGQRQSFQPQALLFGDVLQQIVSTLDRLIPANVSVSFQDVSEGALALVDHGRLHQVVLNLVLNATQALEEGGQILVRVSSQETTVRLEVADSGPGISEDIREKLFDSFFTTRAEGTGLGLAMTQEIVELHDGTIELKSGPLSGACFVIELPKNTGKKTPRSSPELIEAGRGETILVVESQLLVRQLLVSILSGAGYNTLEAMGLSEALAHGKKEQKVDLLLSGLVLDGGRGIELAQRLRNERPELPAVFISGYAGEIDQELESQSSSLSLLHKPFSPKDLLVRVQRAMKARKTD